MSMSSCYDAETAPIFPPHDLDAECALLGAMIINPKAITVVRDGSLPTVVLLEMLAIEQSRPTSDERS